MNVRTILHPTDFSSNARRASEQTQSLADAFGASVHLFHKVVYPLPQTPVELLGRLNDADAFERLAQESLVRPLDDARARLTELASEFQQRGIDASTHLVTSGEAHDAVCAQLDQLRPDLVILGTHGRSGVDRVLMGSVAEKTIRHASCPVLVVPPKAPLIPVADRLGRVLVPVDFSATSRAALRDAKSLAVEHGVRLEIVHVIDAQRGPFVSARLSTEQLENHRQAATKLISAELATTPAQIRCSRENLRRKSSSMQQGAPVTGSSWELADCPASNAS